MKTLKALSLALVAAAFASSAANAQTVIHISGSSAFRAPCIAAVIDYLNNGGATVYGGYVTSTTAFEPGIMNSNPAIFANGKLYNGTTTTGSATVIVECYFSGSAAGVCDLAIGKVQTNSFIDAGTSTVASTSLTGAQIDAINNGATCTGIGDAQGDTVYGGGVNLAALTAPLNSVVKVSEPVDMAFSDVSNTAAASIVGTASLHAPISGPTGTYSSIAQIKAAMSASNVVNVPNGSSNKFEGIVTFEWVAGNITSGAVTAGAVIPTNMTQQAAVQLITNGNSPQSIFTGTNNAEDASNLFLLTGRNEDSGTRIVSLADSQFGYLNAPFQFIQVDHNSGGTYTGIDYNTGGYGTDSTAINGNAGTGTGNLDDGSLNTEPNIFWSADAHSGQASGANVAQNLTWSEDGSVGGIFGVTNEKDFAIGYLGTADAYYAINGGAHAMSYAGVQFSVQAIQNGQYSMWNYEHAYQLSSLSSALQPIATGIATLVYSTDADISPLSGVHGQAANATAASSTSPIAGILYNSSFHVTRLTEGGQITHL